MGFFRENLWFSGLGTPNDLKKKRTNEIIPSLASVYVPTNFWLDVFVANPIWYLSNSISTVTKYKRDNVSVNRTFN